MGGPTEAKTLEALGKVLFPAAETLERTLQERGALKTEGDVIDWELLVEGPDWDYTAQGCVTRTRGINKLLGRHRVTFHIDKMSLSAQVGGSSDIQTQAKYLATGLEAQEMGLEDIHKG